VNIRVGGQSAGTKIADPNGAITVAITITSTATADINDPVTVDIGCGSNTATATGPGLTGGAVAVTAAFTVVCASTSPTASGPLLARTGEPTGVPLTAAAGLLILVLTGRKLLRRSET